MSSDVVSITRCAPGKRTPKDQIKPRDRPPSIIASSEARGLSGQTMLSTRQQEDEAEIMSVARNQPHRQGVSTFPGDAWMTTALGRFCCARWRDIGTQREHWRVGERYAQLVDAERIARGEPPRQCAESETGESSLTVAEAMDRRKHAESRLAEAEDAMREVDARAVRAVRDLAWSDLDIRAHLHGLTFNALYRLSVHFERIDKPKKGIDPR
jgi:hypothetical protein